MKDFGGGLIFPESQHGIPFEDPADEDYCERCEGDGSYSELADCTTGGPDCGCHERVLIDPCPECGGSGLAPVDG